MKYKVILSSIEQLTAPGWVSLASRVILFFQGNFLQQQGGPLIWE